MPIARAPEALTMDAIAVEVIRARVKFPGREHLFAALAEEVGELATALMDGERDAIESEAIQVAAMAIRIIEEGDATYGVGPLRACQLTDLVTGEEGA